MQQGNHNNDSADHHGNSNEVGTRRMILSSKDLVIVDNRYSNRRNKKWCTKPLR
jgi:hypothetical protein